MSVYFIFDCSVSIVIFYWSFVAPFHVLMRQVNIHVVDWLIVCVMFYAVSAVFQSFIYWVIFFPISLHFLICDLSVYYHFEKKYFNVSDFYMKADVCMWNKLLDFSNIPTTYILVEILFCFFHWSWITTLILKFHGYASEKMQMYLDELNIFWFPKNLSEKRRKSAEWFPLLSQYLCGLVL